MSSLLVSGLELFQTLLQLQHTFPSCLGHGCDEDSGRWPIEVSGGKTLMYFRTMQEGSTSKLIRAAVQAGRLNQPFRAADVNRLLGIDWAGVFLPKHCVGNGHTTELFVRVDRGLYRLK